MHQASRIKRAPAHLAFLGGEERGKRERPRDIERKQVRERESDRDREGASALLNRQDSVLIVLSH